MALPVNGSTHLIPAYYSFYRPRKDERLSWPSWLTYSGWLTHNSGHPSAAGQAQDRESSPAKDRRSTTVPHHQLRVVPDKGPLNSCVCVVVVVAAVIVKACSQHMNWTKQEFLWTGFTMRAYISQTELNGTDLHCNKLSQLHDVFIGHTRQHYDLIGCRKTGTFVA